MLSLFSSIPMSLITTFVTSPTFWIGYAICVICPIPFINSFIIKLWSTFGSKIVGMFKSTEATVVSNIEGTVVNAVETAVANAISTKL